MRDNLSSNYYKVRDEKQKYNIKLIFSVLQKVCQELAENVPIILFFKTLLTHTISQHL